MAFTESVGAATINGLAYVGGLARITGGAAKALFVEPARVGKLLNRSVHQAMAVGVEALPIVSLISFFIGLIFALQSAYQLRKLGALQFVAAAVAIRDYPQLGAGWKACRAQLVTTDGGQTCHYSPAYQAACKQIDDRFAPLINQEFDALSRASEAADRAAIGKALR